MLQKQHFFFYFLSDFYYFYQVNQLELLEGKERKNSNDKGAKFKRCNKNMLSSRKKSDVYVRL